MFVATAWLLLGLWGALFNTIGSKFFGELFTSAGFVYPATAIIASIGAQLAYRSARLLDTVHTQILNLLRWLAPLAGLIVVLFTVTLLPKLPALAFSGERAIGAHWLLLLVAVNVLLLNAAYQDGREAAPYGPWISNALRLVPPLLVIVAVTALYALIVRWREYGLTVSRFWGLVAAVMACAYSLGYTVCAWWRNTWYRGLGRVNVALGWMLLAGLLLALTAPLAPQRLSATSQQAIALSGASDRTVLGALAYLRFSGGGYGARALQALREHADRSADGRLKTALADVQRLRWRGDVIARPPASRIGARNSRYARPDVRCQRNLTPA